MKIVIMSDNHGKFPDKLPGGDLLIHCGDYSYLPQSFQDTTIKKHFDKYHEELLELNAFFESNLENYKKIIFVPGNHDYFFEREEAFARGLLTSATVLIDQESVFEGMKIWGGPVSPRFFDWAFQRGPGIDISKHWDLIPADVDILVTHTPPKGILDELYSNGKSLGCTDLAEKMKSLSPKVHCFGHIHEGYGVLDMSGVTYVNGSILDEKYNLKNEPIVVEL